MATNPVVGVELPRPEQRDQRVLEPEEVRRIAEAIDDRYRALVLVCGFGGLRIGEALGLRWRNVDLPRRTVRVIEQATEVGGEVRNGQALKTPGSRRTVTLPAFVAEAIAIHAERYGPASPAALVFRAPGGGPVRRTNYRRRAWLPALDAAGVPHATPHDLRHFAASAAIASGAHPKAIQARLGHASIRTTLDRYGHLFDGTDAELADALDRYAPRDGTVVPLTGHMRSN
jgi:integrase